MFKATGNGLEVLCSAAFVSAALILKDQFARLAGEGPGE